MTVQRVGLVAQQTIDRGNLFITPVGRLIVEVDFPRQSQSLVKPKPYSLLVGGETVEPDAQHELDRLAAPLRLYQDVRDDLAKYSPVDVTRAALAMRDHKYVGVIDSDGTPFRFVLSSRGIKVDAVPEAGLGEVWEEFDRLMEDEQRLSRTRRREQAHQEQVAIDRGVEKTMKEALPLVITDEVEKALPKKSSETPVKKTPAKKASTKKVGSKGNTRYGYPQEGKDKGTPPAAPAAANPVKVPREPEGDPQVDPAEFANQFGLSIDTLQRVANRFASSDKLGGRDGFASFMRRQLSSAAKKHRLDGDYWGLLFEALTTESSPAT